MTAGRPWYREPLVWLIIAFPMIAVVAGLATFYIAHKTSDGMVVDDYYQKGKEINMSLARDRAAAHLGLNAELRLDGTSRQVVVTLVSRSAEALPERLELNWLHATRAGFDQPLLLVRLPDGSYRAPLPELVPGHWYIQIETRDWRLQGSLRIPGESRLVLAPAPVAGAAAR